MTFFNIYVIVKHRITVSERFVSPIRKEIFSMKKNYRGFQKRLLPVFLAMVLAIALFPVVTMASESDFIFARKPRL